MHIENEFSTVQQKRGFLSQEQGIQRELRSELTHFCQNDPTFTLWSSTVSLESPACPCLNRDPSSFDPQGTNQTFFSGWLSLPHKNHVQRCVSSLMQIFGNQSLLFEYFKEGCI